MVLELELLEFIADGGYQTPTLWLSEGWSQVVQNGWQAPQYWRRQGEDWHEFTLSGLRPVAVAEPAAGGIPPTPQAPLGVE